jgi:hypothetical protein
MSDANLEWLLNAKRLGVAPVQMDGRDPALEVEMWQHYRARLLAELDQVERLLRAAVATVAVRAD